MEAAEAVVVSTLNGDDNKLDAAAELKENGKGALEPVVEDTKLVGFDDRKKVRKSARKKPEVKPEEKPEKEDNKEAAVEEEKAEEDKQKAEEISEENKQQEEEEEEEKENDAPPLPQQAEKKEELLNDTLPELELQELFREPSPMETNEEDAGKSSPVIRCKTRRSQIIGISTPKTPKAFLQMRQPLIGTPDLDISNVATTESDETRAEFNNDETVMSSDYMEYTRNRSVRALNSRKSIRPWAGNQSITDGIIGRGLRRRRRSDSPDAPAEKRLRTESFYEKLCSPLRSRFGSSSVVSSTPVLTSYRSTERAAVVVEAPDFDDAEEGLTRKTEEEEEKKDRSWCVVM